MRLLFHTAQGALYSVFELERGGQLMIFLARPRRGRFLTIERADLKDSPCCLIQLPLFLSPAQRLKMPPSSF